MLSACCLGYGSVITLLFRLRKCCQLVVKVTKVLSPCCLGYGRDTSLLFVCYFVPGDGRQTVNHFQKKDDVDADMTMARTGGGRKEVQKEASNKRREAGRRRRDFLAELTDRGCIHLGIHRTFSNQHVSIQYK